jgi:hypothetical protein
MMEAERIEAVVTGDGAEHGGEGTDAILAVHEVIEVKLNRGEDSWRRPDLLDVALGDDGEEVAEDAAVGVLNARRLGTVDEGDAVIDAEPAVELLAGGGADVGARIRMNFVVKTITSVS